MTIDGNTSAHTRGTPGRQGRKQGADLLLAAARRVTTRQSLLRPNNPKQHSYPWTASWHTLPLVRRRRRGVGGNSEDTPLG